MKNSQVLHSPIVPVTEEIQTQLRDILASPSFHGSKRCQQFLEYVCLKSLSGEIGSLKERSIAVEVFGRQPQSDMGDDTIVRVGAREVRKRLAQYYVTANGVSAPVVIDLPSGSYAPEFRYAVVKDVLPAEPISPAPLVQLVISPVNHYWRWAASVALLAICGSAAAWMYVSSTANSNKKAFNLFWAPVFQSNEPMLVAVGHPIVYHISRRAHILSEERLPPQRIPSMQRAVQLPPELISGSDVISVQNQYVGFGDMIAANDVSTMLSRRTKHVRVRMASAVEFADLRNTQSLIIGAITNRWSMELQNGWRFQFARTDESSTVIKDTQTPGRQWSIPSKEDGSTAEDYFLICRVNSPIAGGNQFVVAGLKQFGTEAAGRLIA